MRAPELALIRQMQTQASTSLPIPDRKISANEERMANVAADDDALVAEPAQADSQTEALAAVPSETPVEPESHLLLRSPERVG